MLLPEPLVPDPLVPELPDEPDIPEEVSDEGLVLLLSDLWLPDIVLLLASLPAAGRVVLLLLL